jgi:hypothetical protein
VTWECSWVFVFRRDEVFALFTREPRGV